jgi:hypothetical protein
LSGPLLDGIRKERKIMKCLEARAYVKFSADGKNRQEALLHASQCRACQPVLKAELILERLLEAGAASEVSRSEDTYRGIRMRINREIAGQSSARRVLSATWESAVLQFQNWVYAGSLAAVLVLGMVAYSGGFGQPSLAGRDRLSDAMISQRSERLVLTRPDPMSQDEVLYALLSEDY